MRAAAIACAAVLALSACSRDGDDDEEASPDDGESVCPVDPGLVTDLLGYAVVIDTKTATSSSCRFLPSDADAHPGAHVIVAERELAAEGYVAALASVEAATGPAELLPEGSVGGIDRGWVARLGRVVQVGAAHDRRLVQVTVADAALDVEGAEEVAIELAREAID